ncbi:beta-galactosidase [Hoeflea sp.]|uniref:beta-galactosidase n=1 Tax=Hoeflea sp. TaxID=1940281 RepID=UPI003BB16144
MKRAIGVCYYPEHWDPEIWTEDARRMADAGIEFVRIGEFAWSRMEPEPGSYQFEWLDVAIRTLGEAGLKVVLGTPTATPPRWMLQRHPDMLAVDAQGRKRGFGSRRHYDFSHEGYKAECGRIVTELAKRYGANPHIAAWQTDNEYGCHDTVLSWSSAARDAFRQWLRLRYPGAGNDGDINALNEAWGNVFWSMEYRDFDEIDLPNLTVTEPNPSHSLDFRRFSSDQVVAFNRVQTEIIRQYSSAPIAHNYMGKVTEFDHFAVGADLDIASWDSYPLGFLEDRIEASDDYKRRFARQGDADFQAFHHDLYRAVGRGRMWVMEQQPGPVNWAPYNPFPAPGMVRLWAWEAFAHGAEVVSYFRWRQAPMAQEQMHAGLLRPDSSEAPGLAEAARVAREIADAPNVSVGQAPVAIVFDYDADFAWTTQPQGRGLDYFWLVFDFYKALRSLSQSIDILMPSVRDFSGYELVVVPGMMHMPADLKATLAESDASVLVGPRSACRDASMRIPVPLPPALPGLDVTVARVETLRADMPVPLAGGGTIGRYVEALEGSADVMEKTEKGEAVLMAATNLHYLGGWPDQQAARRILANLLSARGVKTELLPGGLRVRDTPDERFWFNYADEEVELNGRVFPPCSVTIDNERRRR